MVGSCLLAIALPPARAQSDGRSAAAGRAAAGSPSLAVRQKLAAIILPSVEFHQTTLGDALEFLRQESRRLDPDPNPQTRGVNFFLKLPAAPSQAGTTGPNAGVSARVSSVDPTAAAPLPSASTRVTLTMSRLPLLEALRYLAKEVGLKVRVETYAVSLVPLTEDADPLLNATFRVSPGFIPNQTSGQTGGALNQGATGAP